MKYLLRFFYFPIVDIEYILKTTFTYEWYDFKSLSEENDLHITPPPRKYVFTH